MSEKKRILIAVVALIMAASLRYFIIEILDLNAPFVTAFFSVIAAAIAVFLFPSLQKSLANFIKFITGR